MRLVGTVIVWALSVVLVPEVRAQAYTPGNLLVTQAGLTEYTLDGTVVSTIAVPRPAGSGDAEGVVMDSAGRIHVLNTSFSEDFVSTYDPPTGQFVHTPIDHVQNNQSDGDLAILGRTLYAKDSSLTLPGFVTAPMSVPGFDPTEISAGLDGFLYVVGDARTRVAKVTTSGFIFATFAIGPVAIGAITADANGDVFTAGFDGMVRHYSPGGQQLLTTLDTGLGGLVDIDVAPDGTLVVGSSDGTVVVTDTSLAAFTTFVVGSRPAYVTLIPALPGPGPKDVGVLSINTPVTGAPLGRREFVEVTLGNFNNAPQGPVPVQLSVTGPINTTVVDVFTDVVPGLWRRDWVVSTPIDMSLPGTYTIQATTLVSGDVDPTNNSATGTAIGQAVVVGIPYVQDFETGDGGFVTAGSPSSWEVGVPNSTWVPAAASGTRAWCTDLDGKYFLDEQSYLVAPPIDCTGCGVDPTLEFSLIFNTAGGGHLWLEMALDEGPFQKVGTATSPGGSNWYNVSSLDLWSGSSGGQGVWLEASHVLVGAAGRTVRLRWALRTGSIRADGFAIDHVRLSPTTFGGGQAPRPGLALLDANGATEGFGFPINLGFPGPYRSTVSASNDLLRLHVEGPRFAPVVLLGGGLSVSAYVLPSIGQIDLNPVSVWASGAIPGGINSFFFIGATGVMDLGLSVPSAMVGSTIAMQAALLPDATTVLLTNAVEVTIDP